MLEKSLNTLIHSTPSFQTTLIAFLGYWLTCKVFLHHLDSKVSKISNNLGLKEMQRPVSNLKLCSFVKTIIQLPASLKPKVFIVPTANFGDVLNSYLSLLINNFVLIRVKLQ